MTVTSVDVTNDVVNAEAHITHAYSGPGPWTATIANAVVSAAATGT